MKINDILIEAGISTTAHGIPKIISSKLFFLRIIWSIFLLISVSVCCFMVFKSVNNYCDYEVVTKTTLTNQLPSEFPAITICNRSPFVTNESKSFYEKDHEILTKQLGENTHTYKLFEPFNLSIENQKKLGLELKELINDCHFNNEACNYTNDFVWFYDFFFGNCFTFNSGKDANGVLIGQKNIFNIGKDFGLKLKVFTGNYIYPEHTGLRIVIHNSSINPSTFEGIMVPTGFETNIAVNRLYYFKQPNPYSKCVSNIVNHRSDLVQEIIKSGYQYRQYDCYLLCFQRFLVNKTGCYFPAIMKLYDAKLCLSIEEFKRVNPLGSYIEFSSIDRLDYFQSSCPLECDYIQYSTTVSHANIKEPENSIEKYTKLSLNIYYDTWSYTKIEETPKTDIVDLIANIGGTLGLFIGMSILSFGEIFELIFLIVNFLLKKNQVESS